MSTPFQALVVDDERLARDDLAAMLRSFPNVQVAGTAADGIEAIEAIDRLRPDVVFLDVRISGCNGFEVLERIDPPVPHVIFTTAFGEFAVKAFEVQAIDYLLKPIEPDRLAESIERLERIARPAQAAPAPLEAPDAALPSPTSLLRRHERVFVREGDQCWFVEIGDIRLFESVGNYTRIFFDKNQPLLPRSLAAMEQRLDPGLFFRANRQQIVNLEWIESVEPWFSQCLRAKLKSGETVEFSRRQTQRFRDRSAL